MKNQQIIFVSIILTVFGCLFLSCAASQSADGGLAECDSFSCPLQSVALTDTNPTSQTYEQDVAPAEYIGWVSGWYFGHST